MKLSSNSSGPLTQSEHWFQILAETSPLAILVFREKILFANRAAVELTGYSESELLEMSFEELLPAGRKERSAAEDVVTLVRKDRNLCSTLCSMAYVEMDWQPATLLTAIDISTQQRAEEQLQQTRERLELAQKAARWITWEWLPDTDRLSTSSLTDSLLGIDLQKMLHSGADFLNSVHPEDRDRMRRAVERFLKGREDLAVEVRCLTPRGDIRWASVSCTAVRNSDGWVERAVGVAHDVTEQKITENALFLEKDRAFVTLSSIADGVIRTDSRGVIDYLNPVAQRLTGWSLAESYGQPSRDIYQVVDEETGKKVLDPVRHCLDEQREVVFLGQRLLIRRDGSRFPIHDSAAPIRDRRGRLTGAILVFRDLTQVRQVEEEIQHLASHDALTGLTNRPRFEQLVREVFVTARDTRPRHALCHLDLDAFKLINDSCGHTAGDQLIRQIASVIDQRIRHGDLLARLGADEFAVLFRECSAAEAQERAQEICDAIHRFRFHWDGRTFTQRVSAGLVPVTAETSDPESFLGAADAACFVAKDSGGGRIHVFEPGDTTIAERYGEMQWVSRIQKAFDEQRFCLWQQSIQPIRGTMPEAPLSELFIRLVNDDGKIVTPTSFIPAAERYGLIDSVDRWVVSSALRHMAESSLPRTAADFRFAINISGQSLGAVGFLDHIIDEIEETGIAPNRVLFEITETSAIANLSKAMRFISVLKEMGCLFVLDDFGRGLSSFSYLKTLPLDFIKIDGSFVREMIKDPIQAALVSSIKEIGEVMGLQTIAESVEDEATYEALIKIGVDYVQGFFLDRPKPLTASSLPPLSRRRSA